MLNMINEIKKEMEQELIGINLNQITGRIEDLDFCLCNILCLIFRNILQLLFCFLISNKTFLCRKFLYSEVLMNF